MIEKKKDLIIFIPYFLPDESYGGPVVSINSLVKKISDKVNITIYTNSLCFDNQKIIKTKNFDDKYYKINKTKIIRKDSHFKNFLLTFFKLLNYKNKIIYVNSFFYIPHSLPFFLLSKYLHYRGNKLFISPRAELQKNRIKSNKHFLKKIFILIFQFFSSNSMTILSSSDKEKESNEKIFPNKKQITLPNLPRFRKFFKPSKTNFRKLKLVFFSRISSEKGLHIFLEALKKHSGILPIELNIMGSYSDQKYYEYIKKLSKFLRLKGYIINELGHIKINQNELKKYDVMILPTVGENFSHTVVEASQCGLFNLISDNTPWFKNTSAAKNKYTCISLDENFLFIESIISLMKLNSKEFTDYIIEQQIEVEKEISTSFNKLNFFLN